MNFLTFLATHYSPFLDPVRTAKEYYSSLIFCRPYVRVSRILGKKGNMILGGMGSVRMDPNPTKTCPLGPHSTTPKNIYLSEGSYARDLQAQGAFIPRFFDKRLLSFPFKPILIKFRPLLMHVYNIVTPIHSPPPCIIF